MKTAQSSKKKVDLANSNEPSLAKAAANVIYLDNHATTPLDPEVLQVMMPYLTGSFGNPASTHAYGIKASYAVDKARQQVAKAIGADAKEIFFTSGATESNNFVIKGVFEHFSRQQSHIIVSNIEHKCILEAAKHVKKQGAQVTILHVNNQGLIEPATLKRALRSNTVLVSIMLANNEIGSVNAIKELARISHEGGALFHTDAAQAVGKIPIDVKNSGIDFLSASGHKFYGPKGVGFTYVKQNVQKFLRPLLDGGGQEGQLRSGTLNVAGIVGSGQAIELATADLDSHSAHYQSLRNQLYIRLVKAFPDLILNGPPIMSHAINGTKLKRLPNNLNITLPSIDSSKLRQIYNVAFSSSSACSSNDVKPSYVLKAIGRSTKEAEASLRFGVGRFNTDSDIDLAADTLIKALAV